MSDIGVDAAKQIFQGVLDKTSDDWWRQARLVHERIQGHRRENTTANWELGRDLEFMRSENLWQGHADTWREYVETTGLTQPMESMLRSNYKLYIAELGFEMDDPRLLAASETKLALGTRKVFRPWVLKDFRRAAREREQFTKDIEKLNKELQSATGARAAELRDEIMALVREMHESVTDFIDLCHPDAGLTRADVRAYLEEKVGIERDTSEAALRAAFRAIQNAKVASDELADDEWAEMVAEVRRDEPVMNWLRRVLGVNVPQGGADALQVFLDEHGATLTEMVAEAAPEPVAAEALIEAFGIEAGLAARVAESLPKLDH